MRKLRIGILGGGGILGAHAPQFNKFRDWCEVVAVAEPKEAAAPRLRGFFGAGVRNLC